MSISTSDTDAACIAFDELYGIEFPCISGVEGGGDAICNTYGINAYPTYIMIAPDHSIVEQDMWPIPNTAEFISYFESNGLEQTECSTSSVTAAFGSDLTALCLEGMIAFEDMSSGSVTSWNWTFEGGDPATSTEQNPTVNYAAIGNFDVTLEVSDGNESNSMTIEDYITINELPETMLEPFAEVCLNTPEFELTGGTPADGEYTGTAITNGMFNPEVAGVGTHTITYTYTDENDCVNTAEETIYVDECVGLTEFGENKMRLFPNPTTGVFEIELNYKGNFSIDVLNVIGENIYKMETTSNGYYHNTIDLTGLKSGFYFITLKSSDETIVKKLQLISK